MTSITKNEIYELAKAHDVIPFLAAQGRGNRVSEIEAVADMAETERQNISEAMELLSKAKRRKTPTKRGTYSLKHHAEGCLPSGYVSHAAFVTALLASGFMVKEGGRSFFGEKFVTNVSKDTTEQWYEWTYRGRYQKGAERPEWLPAGSPVSGGAVAPAE